MTNTPAFDFTPTEHTFMARAIELAKKAWFTTSPNPRVGCVLVKDNKIIAEGYHQKAGEPHAEIHALRQAGEKAKGATAFVTLEPCSHTGKTPPCADALIDAQVTEVIAAMVDPNPLVSGNGLKKLQLAGIKVRHGLLEKDAEALNPGFVSLMRHKTPYIRCKLAASLDGKTAMASGESQWITSPESRQDVQRLRAQSCAIISGADSVIFDNAKMTVRWQELGDVKNAYLEKEIRQPIRVIIDGKNRLTPDLAIFQHQSPIIIMTSAIEKEHNWPHFVEQIEIQQDIGSGFLSLPHVIEALASKGLNDILVESGKRLAGAFIELGLVDQLVLFQAPILMGDDSRGLVDLPNVEKLSQAKQISISDVTRVGKDIKITANLNRHF